MKKRILFHVAAVLQEVKMPYVIILLVVLAVIFGVIQTRKMHKAECFSVGKNVLKLQKRRKANVG